MPDNKGPRHSGHSCQRKEAGEEGERAGLSLRKEGRGGAAGWEAEMDGGDGDKTVAGEAEGKMTQNGNMILV